jgi:hypothetical protein
MTYSLAIFKDNIAAVRLFDVGIRNSPFSSGSDFEFQNYPDCWLIFLIPFIYGKDDHILIQIASN